jgi:hypothetical protein
VLHDPPNKQHIGYSIYSTRHKPYLGEESKEDEISREFGTYGGEMLRDIWCENWRIGTSCEMYV